MQFVYVGRHKDDETRNDGNPGAGLTAFGIHFPKDQPLAVDSAAIAAKLRGNPFFRVVTAKVAPPAPEVSPPVAEASPVNALMTPASRDESQSVSKPAPAKGPRPKLAAVASAAPASSE